MFNFLSNVLFLFLTFTMMTGSAFAQATANTSLEGRVTMYNPSFGEDRLYEPVDLVLLPAESISYDVFEGEQPSQHSQVVESELIKKLQAAYISVLPYNRGQYRFKDIQPGDYWVCSVDAEVDEQIDEFTKDMTRPFSELDPIDQPVFIWGCQYISLKAGANKQDFYWNGQGFWIDE